MLSIMELKHIALPKGVTLHLRESDIYIYEFTHICEDCESGNPTHNSFHLPHTYFEVTFNKVDPDWQDNLVEEWRVEDLRDMFYSPIDGECEFSWTQLAIARCNELER